MDNRKMKLASLVLMALGFALMVARVTLLKQYQDTEIDAVIIAAMFGFWIAAASIGQKLKKQI
jgi:capsid protein